MNRTKEYRWEQQVKRKKKTVNLLKILGHRGLPHIEIINPKRVGCYLRTRKPCSCWMCGNPRKFFNEKTKQEIIWESVENEYDETRV